MANKTKALENTKKHYTKEEKLEKKEIEQEIYREDDQLDIAPEWLLDSAWDEWHRIVTECRKGSYNLTNLDYNTLGLYCNSLVRYKEILKNNKKMLIAGEINPGITLELKYADEIKKYSQVLRLTPDGRIRVASDKHSKRESEIEEEFGDI